MKILKVIPHEFAANSYILTVDEKNCVVIDPSAEAVDKIEANGFNTEAVLLTHGHFDHIGGCGELFEKGVKIYCGEKEKELIFSPAYKGLFGGVYVPDFEIFSTLMDGERVSFAGMDFEVLHTPGHTAGGVCYACGDCLFTGDTLFRDGVGRYDLYTGDYKELIKSVKRLFALKGDFRVFCGHGENTALERERKFNPYIKG